MKTVVMKVSNITRTIHSIADFKTMSNVAEVLILAHTYLICNAFSILSYGLSLLPYCVKIDIQLFVPLGDLLVCIYEFRILKYIFS